MDPGFLNSIVLEFKNTLLPIAPQLVDILHPSFFIFLKLAFVLLIAGMMFGAPGSLMSGLFLGTLAIGFAHLMLLFSYQWASDFFSGAVHLSEHLGAEAPNPSAILSLGLNASAPLLKSIGDQGILSYARHPTSIIFALSGIAVLVAFVILAFVQIAFLLWSYVLVAVAPFVAMFSPLPVLRGLAFGWAKQVLGAMMGLFAVGLMATVAKRIGENMAVQYAAVFSDTGESYGWADYAEPLCISIILAIVFAWMPFRFSREAAAVGGSLISGVGGLVMGGGAAVSAASAAVTIPSSGSGSSSPGGSGKSGSSGGSGGGGSSGMGAAQAGKPGWSSGRP